MRTWIGIGSAFAVAALLGALHYADPNAVLQICIGIVALALLAWTVGVAGNAVENVVGIQLAWKRRFASPSRS